MECQLTRDEYSIQVLPFPLHGIHFASGAVRLVGGVSEKSGRVEIYVNGRWGTVCDDGWDLSAAKIVCKELGDWMGGWAVRQSYFGMSGEHLPIWLDDVECNGPEKNLLECMHPPVGVHDCSHEEDAGVICASDSSLIRSDGELRLVGGIRDNIGRLEILHVARWGQICGGDGSGVVADVACRQMGYRGGRLDENVVLAGDGNPLTWLTQVQCTGEEKWLDTCQHGAWGGTCPPGQEIIIQCDEYLDPDMRVEEVRLSGVMSNFKGRVEVRINGEWGTVCDDGFDVNAAMVICRSLGYVGGHPFGGGAFGRGTGPIWLDDLICQGNEQSIDECEHSTWAVHDCSHSEDATVKCQRGNGPITVAGLSITPIDTENGNKKGRVEVEEMD